jgi:predicted small lipoprotein YifL
MRLFFVTGLMGGLLVMSACGLKGDLYLPAPKAEPAPAATPAQPDAQTAPEEDQSKTDGKPAPAPP